MFVCLVIVCDCRPRIVGPPVSGSTYVGYTQCYSYLDHRNREITHSHLLDYSRLAHLD